jgi:DNA-binding Xre family transcriptional regulator
MKMNIIYKISRNLLGMALAVALAGGVAGCNEEVSMTILNKICKGLGVSYGDIIEYIPAIEDNSENEVQ